MQRFITKITIFVGYNHTSLVEKWGWLCVGSPFLFSDIIRTNEGLVATNIGI